jgi:transaldolase
MGKSVNDLKVKIFADGANISDITEMNKNPVIKGMTTNPTLMRKAGITNYKNFALDVLSIVHNKPISFEVFSDEFEEMERQAKEIASWAENVYVKIPITNSKGFPTYELIKRLTRQGIKVNVTAIFTIEQVEKVKECLEPGIPSCVSVFAGRIADTGRNPIPIMEHSLNVLKSLTLTELIWASPRELLNIFQADQIGCHIITATSDILNKIKLIGYNLENYSLDTVKMFYDDAKSSKFQI